MMPCSLRYVPREFPFIGVALLYVCTLYLFMYYMTKIFPSYIFLQLKDGFAEGKDLVVTVMSAMGEEQICALKDIGPKN